MGPIVGSQTQIGFQEGGTGAAYTPAIPWSVGQWYDVQVVREDSTIRMYRDDVLLSEQTTTLGNDAPPPLQNLIFGYRPSPENQFYAMLDDIRIYDRAFSDSEIHQFYAYEQNAAVPESSHYGLSVGLLALLSVWSRRRRSLPANNSKPR